MNNRGQFLLYGLMVGVVIFLLAMGLSPSLSQTIDEARNSTFLNCSTATTQPTQAICMSLDLNNVFIILLIGLGGFTIIRSL